MDKERAKFKAEAGSLFKEALSESIIRRIYKLHITSPYHQLLFIETMVDVWDISYASLSRAIRIEVKDKESEAYTEVKGLDKGWGEYSETSTDTSYTKCISCHKKLNKPCFTINMDDITYIRKRRHQMGTGKGDNHKNIQSPKIKQIDDIINSLDEYHLDGEMKRNIKDNFKDLRPEILTLFAGILRANNHPRQRIPQKETLIMGLLNLIPEREQAIFKYGKPPKYGSKINYKDYFVFWNYASRLRYFDLKNMTTDLEIVDTDTDDPFTSDIRNYVLQQTDITKIPLPCEKDTDYWGDFFDR